MTKVLNFSGIDVSKQSFDVCCEISGKSVSKKFSYTEEGMASFLQFLPEDTHCIMESTGTYHCRLSYFLYEHGIAVSVVNPLSVKRFSQALMLRTKTDRADSRMLIAYGKVFQPKCWKPKEAHYVELQQLIRLCEQLNKQETALNNQLEAIDYSVVRNSFAVEKLQECMEQCRINITQAEQQMELLVRAHEKENFEKLQAIPGIGKKTAIVLIAFTRNMQEFDSAKQISSYFGLCPRIYQSGSSVNGKAKICKMGMSMVRKLLYMCSLSAKKSNRACREIYDRLTTNGKQKKLALIAVANKLLKQAFAIIRNNDVYDENFLQNKLAF
jgi:transposase